MGKRTPASEKPFRPLDESVLSSVISHSLTARSAPALSVPKVVELVMPEHTAARNHFMPSPAPTSVVLHRMSQEQRVLFTREEKVALERLVNNLAARLGTQLKASHVIRAMTSLLLRAESQVDRRAGEHGAMVRPPNGDSPAIQRFDRELSLILANAIRDAGIPV